jgi:uncharacterized glyoxalase superfamily protein PhnB
MAPAVKPVPDGFHSVTPSLVVRDAAKAVEFYKRAFGAEEVLRFAGPDGRSVIYAEVRVGDSIVSLADEMPQMQYWLSPAALKGTTVGLMVYVPDADAAVQRAAQAGATVLMPPVDMFWGDRYGRVQDPFGHVWAFATRKEDLTPGEIAQRATAFFAKMSGGGCG